jgi:plasmid replication initiation protein
VVGVVETLEDILSRFGSKIASAGGQDRAGQGAQPRLLPDRHPVRDFFIADVLDWALKDDRHSMEHPMFALSKIPDIKERRYEHNGNSITITPSIKGLATIWDKDILIYAVSQLVAAMNAGRQDLSPIIRLTAYDLLVSTNRHTGGGDYDQLQKAFERLAGTRITTDIRTNGVRQREGFGLIDAWKIIEKHPVNGRMVAIELRLSDWLYNAILGREVLTLSRDYFRLFGGLERRLYELARKHCGYQAKWAIGVDLLHKKTGSTATLRKFRELLRRTAETDALPDYRIRYDPESEQAVFYTKNAQMLARHIADTSGY